MAHPSIRLLAVDLDGTLLPQSKQILPRTREALRQAVQKGIHVVLASGRMPASIGVYADGLELTDPYAALNGAILAQQDGQRLLRLPIPQPTLADLLRLLKQAGLPLQLYGDNHLFIQEPDEHLLRWFKRNAVKTGKKTTPAFRVTALGDALFSAEAFREEIYKIAVFSGNKAEVEQLHRQLVRFPVTVASSAAHNLEITAPAADKGEALHFLCNHLQIPLEETMAIGDNTNDLPMLRAAGLAIAMGNAPAAVRNAAHWVTQDCEHDGVAIAVERFLFAPQH
ncbi:MAG: HAD family phosphatase [Firmicutes bacterium]|nr:HAD family phosphatase [Bacillota bacterium]